MRASCFRRATAAGTFVCRGGVRRTILWASVCFRGSVGSRARQCTWFDGRTSHDHIRTRQLAYQQDPLQIVTMCCNIYTTHTSTKTGDIHQPVNYPEVRMNFRGSALHVHEQSRPAKAMSAKAMSRNKIWRHRHLHVCVTHTELTTTTSNPHSFAATFAATAFPRARIFCTSRTRMNPTVASSTSRRSASTSAAQPSSRDSP